MTPEPYAVGADTSVAEAALVMRDAEIGGVMVCTDGRPCGFLTDRDITVRVVAEGLDPIGVQVADVCSRDLVTVTPTDTAEEAIALMRERALRRVPVIDNGRAVGIVSLGDLALRQDQPSALADISGAPANR